MVLEGFVNASDAEKRPLKVFLLGSIYALIASVLALTVFKNNNPALMLVFFTTLASVPLINNLMRKEEEADKILDSEKNILKEHSKAIEAFTFLFLGFLITFVLIGVLMPNDLLNKTFDVQINEIGRINAAVSGNVQQGSLFERILMNNLRVSAFVLIFSLIYGFGAIYILAWNASVIAAATILLAKTKTVVLSGIVSGTAYAIGRYMTHGLFEIIAYFTVALAGGILSYAILKKDISGFKDIYSKKIMKDVGYLILISLGILIFAAYVETYITPKLF